MGPRRRRVVWTEGAIRDLEASISFIAEDSPQNASRLLQRILDAAESLADVAERGRVVSEYSTLHTRELLQHPFRLLYQFDESEVRVIALLHQRRHFDERG